MPDPWSEQPPTALSSAGDSRDVQRSLPKSSNAKQLIVESGGGIIANVSTDDKGMATSSSSAPADSAMTGEPIGTSNVYGTLMPAFTAPPHLSNPQSPHYANLYIQHSASYSSSPSSNPSYYRSQGLPLTATNPRRHYEHASPRPNKAIAPKPEPGQAIQQMATPESSPMPLSAAQTLLHPFSQEDRVHLMQISQSQPSFSVKRESGLAPTHAISPLLPTMQSPNPASISRLSSPFTDRAGTVAGNALDSPRTPSPISNHVVAFQDALMTPGSSSPAATNPTILATPIPTRPAGGEMSRIRLQAAGFDADRAYEMERRRPDYLRRAKRPADDMDIDPDMFSLHSARDTAIPGLGIADSPQKGRRLQLFQETSEESFEQSLTIDGYRSYGSCPAYNEPLGNGPLVAPATGFGAGIPNSLPNTLTPHTVDWLSNAPSRGQTLGAGDELLDEKEFRKRKRLAAFTDAGPTSGTTRLYAVEIEGKGRCLSDVPAEQLSETLEGSPTKKRRGNARGKKSAAGPLVSPSKKGISQRTASDAERPNWADKEFPWSLRQHERLEQEKEETGERMKWIEKFLERDSDESDQEEHEVLPSTSIGQMYEDPPAPARWGRGKVVSLKADPEGRPHPQRQRLTVVFPSDPADARAALMSKKSIRALAFAKQGLFLDEESEEEEVLCVCNGRDDGRDLVQCDDCQTWYHLHCLGIRDVSELGEEDDPWYCVNCEAAHRVFDDDDALEVRSEPTFAPTDDRLSTKKRVDPILFSAVQASPTQPWLSSAGPLQTPSRRKTSSSTTRPNIFGEPSTPRNSTSRGVKLYSTPGQSSHSYDDYADFDPMSTPSRGRGLFDGHFTTPKTTSWSTRAGSLFQTPTHNRRAFGSFGSIGGSGFTPADDLNFFFESPSRKRKSSAGNNNLVGEHIEGLDLAHPSSPGSPTPRPRARPLGSSSLDGVPE